MGSKATCIVRYLVDGLQDGNLRGQIVLAARELEDREIAARHLAERYRVEGRVAIVEVEEGGSRYDKTLLLLLGQRLAPVSIVRDRGTITVAAAFDSGIDFIQLLGIEGDMPTRISLSDKRLPEVLRAINRP